MAEIVAEKGAAEEELQESKRHYLNDNRNFTGNDEILAPRRNEPDLPNARVYVAGSQTGETFPLIPRGKVLEYYQNLEKNEAPGQCLQQTYAESRAGSKPQREAEDYFSYKHGDLKSYATEEDEETKAKKAEMDRCKYFSSASR